ncbi:YARHG domain-containing protein [Candidatus Saccharibacteria bacterium]|nr:YARHG domain-containing protein [Candidatus Saccharibacteria bacterium]
MVDFAAYFNSKEYDAAERLYTHIDLKNPVAIHKEWLPQILYPLISRDVISEALERLYVAQLRNEIFARHGKKPDTMAMYMIFGDFLRGTKSESVSWYEYNPNYSDDLLNDIEKKNIKFIEDYERERGWR